MSNVKSAPKAEAPAPNIDSLLGDLEAMSQSTKTPAGASLEESIVQVAENLKKVRPSRHLPARMKLKSMC